MHIEVFFDLTKLNELAEKDFQNTDYEFEDNDLEFYVADWLRIHRQMHHELEQSRFHDDTFEYVFDTCDYQGMYEMTKLFIGIRNVIMALRQNMPMQLESSGGVFNVSYDDEDFNNDSCNYLEDFN